LTKETLFPAPAVWIKASGSSASGSCVEASLTPSVVLVRDSKDRRVDSPVVALSSAAWTAFLLALAPEDN
jgi:hypothetical protein